MKHIRSLYCLIIFFSTCALFADCIEVRAGFDVGSGTTKLKVARVDVCEKRIIEVLQERQLPLNYKKDLAEAKVGPDASRVAFSQSVMDAGIEVIRELKKSAALYNPTRYHGVATAAFREADNANDFIKRILQDTQVNIEIISQEEEAKRGFWIAAYLLRFNPDRIVVWDIGGSSMQMTAKSSPKVEDLAVYQGDMGSVPFKNEVLESVKNLNFREFPSPNPMSKLELQKATALAEAYALQNVPLFFKDKTSQKGVYTIGIGNVHAINVQQAINPAAKSFTRAQIEKILDQYAGFSDADLKNAYAETFISNLTLVLGFMKALDIETVLTPRVHLIDSVLID